MIFPTLTAFDAFVERLKNFDWYYSFSDDGRVWRNGRDGQQKLEADSHANKYFEAAYKAYSTYIGDNIRGAVVESALRQERDLVIDALRDGLVYAHANNWDDTVPAPVKSAA